uniref:Serine/threonine-protein kinase Sgk1 n=1 Tax=Steinernema glaseri TaxID=37863 RepID=A0A1I8ANT6_9BILA
MKVLDKDHIKKRNEVQHVMAERNVLISNFNHPFLVSMHYSFQTPEKLYFVLDSLNGGELFFHLQQEKHFKEPRARLYAAEIASALGYLHGMNVIYRDLKPENLLLDRKGHVVLTDFGLCKEGIRPNDTTETFCGTPEYLAPEVILKKPYDRTVDWWCLGTVLYEMLFGLPPFYSQDRTEMYDRIINQKLTISQLASANSRDILTNLLQKDRTKRLGAVHDFKEIQRHPFFKEIDWVKLDRREIKPEFVPPVKDEYDLSFIDSEFTQVRPNPASLIPPNALSHQDLDFLGFTYCNKNNLDGDKDDRRA